LNKSREWENIVEGNSSKIVGKLFELVALHRDCFISFQMLSNEMELPEKLTFFQNETPHPLCLLACKQLQDQIAAKNDWHHNFGLMDGQDGPVIGKMFGVLVVQNDKNEVGYIAGFSGKIAGGYHHEGFVPPVFDSLTEGSFLNVGMTRLTAINREIAELMDSENLLDHAKADELKETRKSHSIQLQNQLFGEYIFLNSRKEEESLLNIFSDHLGTSPPAGAGDCAGPKLFQYAFKHGLKPLAMAEFWWGQSPKSEYWRHGEYYAVCKEKCHPILKYMLQGVDMESPGF
jgi:tRNA pseudouridine32 synthase / 23S rRNA pseudouridine746 synthase